MDSPDVEIDREPMTVSHTTSDDLASLCDTVFASYFSYIG